MLSKWKLSLLVRPLLRAVMNRIEVAIFDLLMNHNNDYSRRTFDFKIYNQQEWSVQQKFCNVAETTIKIEGRRLILPKWSFLFDSKKCHSTSFSIWIRLHECLDRAMGLCPKCISISEEYRKPKKLNRIAFNVQFPFFAIFIVVIDLCYSWQFLFHVASVWLRLSNILNNLWLRYRSVAVCGLVLFGWNDSDNPYDYPLLAKDLKEI